MEQPSRWSIAPRKYPSSLLYFESTTQNGEPVPEQDYVLDAFDRELLAGTATDCFRPNEELARHPLQSVQKHLAKDGFDQQRLHCDPFNVRYPSGSSPSSAAPLASPTVAVVQHSSQVSSRVRSQTSKVSHNIQKKPRKHVTPSKIASRRDWMPPATSFDLAHAPPTVQGISLVPADRLPDHMRSVFKFELFNAVQSKCFPAAFDTDDNMVVSAPTGSGKTAIMELAICRLLSTNKNHDFKVVYQAPTKSLCSERYRDWTAKFDTLGLKCAELTGDVQYAHLRSVQRAHIIITTPEKWDSVTRAWKDNAKLIQMVKLFLIDEVHILNETRGATLEAVVSRMKSTSYAIRFIALSATVPNSEDVATWLGLNSSSQHTPAHCEVFEEEFRPVKLEKHVLGYHCSPNGFALDSMLMKEIPTIIARYAKRKPVMIFCVTKSSAARTASFLAELWESTTDHLRLWNAPKQIVKASNRDLQKLLSAGVAFHHSGLDYDDRRAIEQGFLSGNTMVICSTSTLAVGVNLPCYLVILKGTHCWSDGGLQEYSSLEVMQMLGRAGRPQYETSACAVILTHKEKAHQYEAMVSGQEVLESSLHKNLIEHLNAEIGIGTIHDISSARKWLSSTFLMVRLQKNPGHYHLHDGSTSDDPDTLLQCICERDIELLESAELIEHRNGLRCTKYGEAMTRYYIEYKTMLVFLKLPAKAKLSEILNLLAEAHEFCGFRVRAGEKAMYKQINKSNDIRFPIKVDIALPSHKVSLIIQAQLGGVSLEKSNIKYASQFKQDSMTVMNNCNRLVRCIIDMQIYRQDAAAVKNSLELCRSLGAGVWDNTPMQLKQIDSIGDVTARKLAAAGIRSIDDLLNMEPQRIELVLGKSQPFGDTLLKRAGRFPNLRISIRQVDSIQRVPSKGVKLRLECEIGYLNETLPVFFNRKGVYVCFLCETSCGKLLDFRRFSSTRLKNGEQILLTVYLDQPCSSIDCHVTCDEIAGTNRHAQLRLDIPNGWFPPPQGNNVAVPPKCTDHSSGKYEPEDFDDVDLTDSDFLAAESHINEAENVEGNIEQVQQNQFSSRQPTKALKRKVSNNTECEAQDVISKGLREPTRLPNGNWTCQHTCIDEGKVCKHQCCKYGVKKPKKRAKLVSNNAVLPVSAGDVSLEPTNVSAPDSSHGSYGDIVDALCKSSRSLVPYETLPESSMIHIQRPETNHPLKQTGFSNNEQVTDIDDLIFDDLPSTQASFSNQGVRQFDALGKGGAMDSDHEIFDVADLEVDAEDCDWNHRGAMSGRSLGHNTILTAGPVSYDSPVRLDGVEKNSQPEELSALFEANTKSSSEALIPNPSRLETQSLRRIGNSDSSSKLNNEIDNLEDIDCNRFSTSYKSRQQRVADDKGSPLMQAVTIEARANHSGSGLQKGNAFSPAEETVTQNSKLLHEESQKARWAEFPVWMYEQFGAYADIV